MIVYSQSLVQVRYLVIVEIVRGRGCLNVKRIFCRILLLICFRLSDVATLVTC